MRLPPRVRLALALLTALALTLSGCTGLIGAHGHPRLMGAAHAGIHKIRHVVVIMQENRSFDSYFGTFPGADGIPMLNDGAALLDGFRVCGRKGADDVGRDGFVMDGRWLWDSRRNLRLKLYDNW